jgi:uncharacterized membrane protein (UPF0127 family)
MTSLHITKDGTVLWEARLADTFFTRLLGLMFRPSLPHDQGLLIEFSPHFRSRAVHGFFMRFPIDLVFIDDERKVTDMALLKPWSIYDPKAPCRWVLEVNAGEAKKKGIKIGDMLEF